jgi:Transposase DNA-binding/Transposase DDE domain
MEDLGEEFSSLLLPDARLVRRLRGVFDSICRDPSKSFPVLLPDDAELRAAYRLVNNRRVTFDALHAAHAERTVERARRAGDVVVIHDTTAIETPYADPSEVGYLNTGRTGYLAHCSMAVGVEPGRHPIPFGVLSVQAEFKAEPPQHRGKKKSAKSKSGGATARSTNKAYLRWERGIEASAQMLGDCARVIHVADREADSYPLFCKVMQLGHGCVFRIRNDRRARLADDEVDDEWSLLSEIASGLQGKCERMVPLSKRGAKGPPARLKTHPPRESRGALLQYSATRVELKRPNYAPASLPETLELTLVRVWEPAPPDRETPVEWMLLTTEPCETAQDIIRVVDLYRARWIIEDFHKALKTGCLIQERQFESRRALLNVLAMYLPIAVHLLWLRTCAREAPEEPATAAFTPLQLTVLSHLSRRKMPDDPTVLQAFWVLAKLGGHIANNGWPGWQVLGRAYVRLTEAVATWAVAAKVTRAEM